MAETDVETRTDCGEWIDCPHCSEKILVQFKSKVWIQGTETEAGGATPPMVAKEKAWRDELAGHQIAVLEQATRTGLLGSFITALERGPHNGIPKNKEKYFLDWLKMAKHRLIPAWALTEFKGLYPNKFVEFYGYNFVGAVVAGGEIMLFLPINLISGTTLKTKINGELRMGEPDAAGVRQWIRTKMGYVPADARIAIEETRKRCIGEYANPVL